MLPQWAEQFVSGREPVRVYTRDAYVDLSDVRDVVRAYRLVAERGRAGGIYNVGSGRAVRSGDVLEMLRAMAGPERPIVETRPQVKHQPIADLTRLNQLGPWRPRIPLRQTVADVLAWWRGHPPTQAER